MNFTRIAAVIFALFLILVALPVCWSRAIAPRYDRPLVCVYANARCIVTTVGPQAHRAGIRPGDVLDVRGIDKRQLYLLQYSKNQDVLTYHVIRGNAERQVTLTAQLRSRVRTPVGIATEVTVTALATGYLVLAAFVLWRRPGPLAFAFGLYSLSVIYSTDLLRYCTGLPAPVFGPVLDAVDVIVATAPPLALIYFVWLFPDERFSRRTVTIATAALVFGYAVCFVHDAFCTSLDDMDKVTWSIFPSALATVTALVIVIAKFSSSSGQKRNRIGWVLAGVVFAGAGYGVSNLAAVGVNVVPPAVTLVFLLTELVLPIAFAYAILRHRVLDVTFAVNRTLVYATITGIVIVVVSVVDWFSGKYVESSRVSLALEAVVTIGFGVTLQWLHRRVERGIDKVLFRERHRAESRIEARMRALDFAESSDTVDSALVRDVVDILRLRSAAVFRVGDDADFYRLAATGWDDAAGSISREHVLVRTLRAEEQSIALADHAIEMDDVPQGGLPAGALRPEIAIPIGLRHQLLGFVLYGHRDGDASIDPEERALLERLAHAASVAYDAIEASQWRNRALAFEGARAGAGAGATA